MHSQEAPDSLINSTPTATTTADSTHHLQTLPPSPPPLLPPPPVCVCVCGVYQPLQWHEVCVPLVPLLKVVQRLSRTALADALTQQTV